MSIGLYRASFAKLDQSNTATLHAPKRHGDVGWDLEAAKDVTIEPGQAVDVPTNVRLQLPEDLWAEIRARSSIARRGLQVDAGTIDPGYRGPLYALVRNMAQPKPNELFRYWNADDGPHVGFRPFEWYMAWQQKHSVLIKKGERVAQVVFHPAINQGAIVVAEADDIELGTERGEDGFGSTGR